MRVLDLAAKDLLRASRSAFLWLMMFAVPVGLAALLYVAFGGLRAAEGARVPVTAVVVVNDDAGIDGLSGGAILADVLSSPDLADLLAVRSAADAASARAAVDAQEAGVAVLIPAGFSAALVAEGGPAAVELYQDPALTVGPAVVRSVLGALVDRLAADAIATRAIGAQLAEAGTPLAGADYAPLAERYDAALAARLDPGAPALVQWRGPAPGGEAVGVLAMMGPVVAGLMLFSAFYAAVNLCESLIAEEEGKTLARLFTTPTPPWAVLAGKVVAGALLVLVQTVVLMVGAHWALGIRWGNIGTLALLEAGLVVAAPGLGVFLMSLARNTRQAGAIIGGGLTLMSALGGLFTPGVPGLPAAFLVMQRFVPQGWALEGWQKALAGAGPGEVWPQALVLAAFGMVLFAVGALRFRRRFAREG